MKRSLWALVIAVPLIVLLALGFTRDPSTISSPLLRHRAPAIRLRTLDHRPFSLASLRGSPVVVNFWASWCVGCKIEHPYLVDAYRIYHPQGVLFVGIVYQDSVSNARAFLREHGGGWPNLQDPSENTAINYGVYGVPETFFIDRNGVIRDKSTGPVTPELLNLNIELLLGSKP